MEKIKVKDKENIIHIYSDGSCMLSNAGGFAAIIFLDNDEFNCIKRRLKTEYIISKEQKLDYIVDIDSLKKTVLIKGSIKDTTNNRMELLAYLNAIRYLDNLDEKLEDTRIKIYTDSAYIVNNMKLKYLRTWEKDNWKTKNRTQVLNLDLVKESYNFSKKYNISFHKVRGHDDDILNILVDNIARKMAYDENEILELEKLIYYQKQNKILNDNIKKYDM